MPDKNSRAPHSQDSVPSGSFPFLGTPPTSQKPRHSKTTVEALKAKGLTGMKLYDAIVEALRREELTPEDLSAYVRKLYEEEHCHGSE